MKNKGKVGKILYEGIIVQGLIIFVYQVNVSVNISLPF